MPSFALTINGKSHTVEAPGDMPLLWVLRDRLGLTGTKFGCGEGLCGACTVREGSETLRSCLLPISAAAGRSFVTIEGLAAIGGEAVQKAWIEADVAHCGYCQPGFLLAAQALVAKGGTTDDAAIDAALDDHLCRCGSYPRIRIAVKRAVEILKAGR